MPSVEPRSMEDFVRTRTNLRRTGLAVGISSAMILLAACSSSTNNGPSSPAASGSPSSTGIPTPSQDAALNAMLPAKIKTAGVIAAATDASYAPNEFFAPDNTTVIGMDVDLGTAIGQVLGVPVKFSNLSFDSIIPALGSRFDIGMSSFSVNAKREAQVFQVSYFTAGTSFMVPAGKNADLTSLDALCGKNAGVEKGTTQLDDVTAQSAKCTAAGKKAVGIQAFPDQNGVNLALSSGRVDAVLADSPVNAYAAQQSNGAFVIVGQPYGNAPYGINVPKTADYQGLSEAILGALKDLQTSGIYTQILTKWGVQAGAITDFAINPPVSG
jgi:polar amino acid transport system substrate-binding protein